MDEEWCRAMLILFRPWRTLEDLKGNSDSWQMVFDATEFVNDAGCIMRNMDVESECEDARQQLRVVDLSQNECISSTEGGSSNLTADHWDLFATALGNTGVDTELSCDFSEESLLENDQFGSDSELADTLCNLYKAAILQDAVFPSSLSATENANGTAQCLVDINSNPSLEDLRSKMNRLCK